MRVKHSDVQTSAGQVAIFESAGVGPSVVMLHGNSLSSKIFSHQLNGSFGETFHAVAIDLPGHGQSRPASSPEKDYTLPGYARVVGEVIDQLSLKSVVLVGISLGGHIALEYMATPANDISGTAIFGTPPVGHSSEDMVNAFKPAPAMNYIFQEDLARKEMSEFLELVTGLPTHSLPSQYLNDIENTDGRSRAMLAASIQRGEIADEVQLVKVSPVPLMVAIGQHDAVVSRPYLDRLTYSNLFGGEVQTIENASHIITDDQQESFDRLLSSFVREVA